MNSKLFLNFFKEVSLLTKSSPNRSLCSLKIGSNARMCRTFTEEDVKSFARLTGDCNPIHLDDNYCKQTLFGKPIVHAMLTNGLVSAVFATLLPGPGSVVVNQTIDYIKPLFVGEEVCAQITVIDVRKRFIQCQYVCSTPEGKDVLKGTAKLVVI